MKFAKRLLTVAGAVALAGLFSVMLAPKAVHAVVSTLVTVANTSADPVPVTNGKDLVQQPFETTICKDSGDGTCAAGYTLLGLSATPQDSFVVPSTDSAGDSVKALVITFVSGTCTAANTVPALSTTVPANAVNGINQAFNVLNANTSNSMSTGVLDQTTTIVAAPGSTVGMFALVTSGQACLMTVNGYLAH